MDRLTKLLIQMVDFMQLLDIKIPIWGKNKLSNNVLWFPKMKLFLKNISSQNLHNISGFNKQTFNKGILNQVQSSNY